MTHLFAVSFLDRQLLCQRNGLFPLQKLVRFVVFLTDRGLLQLDPFSLSDHWETGLIYLEQLLWRKTWHFRGDQSSPFSCYLDPCQ